MTDQIFLHQFKQMPDGMKQELLAFVEYLLYKYKSKAPLPLPSEGNGDKKKPLKAGFLKGSFIIAEDFDEPLEDFKDYME